MRFPDSILDAWRSYSRRRADAVSRRRTLRAVSDLPHHVLKDIGWPVGGRSEDANR